MDPTPAWVASQSLLHSESLTLGLIACESAPQSCAVHHCGLHGDHVVAGWQSLDVCPEVHSTPLSGLAEVEKLSWYT